jgi:uncharacterized protein YcbK (DUF882 family)
MNHEGHRSRKKDPPKTDHRSSPVTGFRHTLFIVLLMLFFAALSASGFAGGAETKEGRFFRRGDGRIHIRNVHSGQEVDVHFLGADGSPNDEALSAIDSVFAFPAKESGEHISPRLIAMLDYFSDMAAPGNTIQLQSGYRSPSYNEKLKKAGGNVARTSTHIDGMAIDFYLEGVDGKALWELIRKENCCGVGHYGGNTVHLDAARPRFWEAATSKVKTSKSDFNRRIYLSTDYDRYKPGERVRLSLSSVSHFGFGVKKTAAIVTDAGGKAGIAEISVARKDGQECLLIDDRKTSRSISVVLPEDMAPGTYRIVVDFCQIPFRQMPSKVESNPFEASAGSGSARPRY